MAYHSIPQFIKTNSCETVADYLANIIRAELNHGKKVLWLLAGGSSIPVAVQTSKILAKDDVSGLTISLTDERYGPVGHKDSNWQQLIESGFSLTAAKIQPVLCDKTIQATTLSFAGWLSKNLKSCDYRIGLFGIGPDGHTAGILPNSSAVSSKDLAAYYDSGTYQRITIAPHAISLLNEIVVYAEGKEKWPILDKLDSEVPANMMPAQLLRQARKITVFNDRKET